MNTSRIVKATACAVCFLLTVLAISSFLPAVAAAADEPPLSKGQSIYVPAYSHIYHGNKEAPLLLSVTLSIRNIDPQSSMTVTRVAYYETQGKLIKDYLDKPMVLGPLGSERYVVPQKDTSGGSGANFIVDWHADQPINPPIVETVMIGTQSQLGISFTSRGEALHK